MGVRVREIRSDTPIAALSTTANSRKIRPTMPPISRIGMKTATSDVLIESTVNPISRAPRNAACTGVIPFLNKPGHIFQHHNRIVHHESG